MNADVLRVNVVHSERSNQSCSKDWSPKSAPCISSPVHDSREVVNKKLSKYEADKGGKRSLMKFSCGQDKPDPQIKGEEEI